MKVLLSDDTITQIIASANSASDSKARPSPWRSGTWPRPR